MLLSSLYWSYSAYTDRRVALENHMRDTSRALGLAVDRELLSIQSTLQVLALSPRLQDENLASFHQEAKAVLALYPGADIILADQSGQQLVNTYIPWGTPLPMRNVGDALHRIFATGQPLISNLFRGAVTGRPLVSLDIPVLRDGKVAYDLAITMPADRFSDILRQELLPPEWVGTVTDAVNRVVGRTRDADKHVGNSTGKGAASLQDGAREGVFHLELFEGGQATGAFTRSAWSGWTVGILVPDNVFTRQIWSWISLQLTLLAAILVVSGLISRRIATRVTRSVRALVAPAMALGQGSPVETGPLPIAEADEVAHALTLAAVLLEQRSRERNDAEQKLRAMAEMMEATLAAAPSGIVTIGADGTITQWNHSAASLLGYSAAEMIGKPFAAVSAPGDFPMAPTEIVAKLRSGQRFRDVHARRRRRDGVVIDIRCSGNPLFDSYGAFRGAVVVAQDITESLRAEEQLRQAQKMEAVGQLTGGIAHDFNNLLTVVMGSLQLLRKRLPSHDARVDQLLDMAEQGTARGAALTQRLLAFGRRQTLLPEALNIPDLVLGMSDLLRSSVGVGVQIETHFPPGLPRALVDANQLELVLLNLAANARDAMAGEGRLIIAVREERDAAGSYVVLSVTDTGAGMDEATLARATEPFFTTKGIGKGTGLGLSMVHGLAAQSGGKLVLKSAQGIGTSAELWLPAVTAVSPGPMPPPTTEAAGPSGESARRRTVLVVDDDPLVLESTTVMLEDIGHIAIKAASGNEALRILHDGTNVDLVVTDQSMPGMTGVQLAGELRRLQPDLPIILATGYGDRAEVLEATLPLLGKPFDQAALAAAICACVAAGSDTGRPGG